MCVCVFFFFSFLLLFLRTFNQLHIHICGIFQPLNADWAEKINKERKILEQDLPGMSLYYIILEITMMNIIDLHLGHKFLN